MITTITPAQVRLALISCREIAILDLRGEDPYAGAHPLFAAALPLGRLELEVLDRLPRKDVLVALYDDGEGLVAQAAERLATIRRLTDLALAGLPTGRPEFDAFAVVVQECGITRRMGRNTGSVRL